MRPLVLLAIVLLLNACSAPPPLPVEPPEPPPQAAAPPSTGLAAVPARIRAALARAAPREAAVVAAPSADAQTIAHVRELDRNVRAALAELEADGGRHVTPAGVKRAQKAIQDLQKHLNEFQAAGETQTP